MFAALPEPGGLLDQPSWLLTAAVLAGAGDEQQSRPAGDDPLLSLPMEPHGN
jgi:hypothetical protein